MMERNGGEFVAHCDKCPEFLDTGEDEFSPAVAEKLRAGWLSKKVKGKWLDMCPACAGGDTPEEDFA